MIIVAILTLLKQSRASCSREFYSSNNLLYKQVVPFDCPESPDILLNWMTPGVTIMRSTFPQPCIILYSSFTVLLYLPFF